jgi:hypothetical protein
MTDYTKLTLEELGKENLRLTQARDEILQEQLNLQTEIDKRVAETQAQATIENMSEADKEALRQALEQTEEE